MSAPDDLYNKIQKNQDNIEQEKLQIIKRTVAETVAKSPLAANLDSGEQSSLVEKLCASKVFCDNVEKEISRSNGKFVGYLRDGQEAGVMLSAFFSGLAMVIAALAIGPHIPVLAYGLLGGAVPSGLGILAGGQKIVKAFNRASFKKDAKKEFSKDMFGLVEKRIGDVQKEGPAKPSRGTLPKGF